MTVKERLGPPFAMLARDNLMLWLSGPGTSAAKPLPDGGIPVPGGWNRLVIEVPHLSAAMAALQAMGAHLRSKPVREPRGRQVPVDDPSGNPVELFEAAPTYRALRKCMTNAPSSPRRRGPSDSPRTTLGPRLRGDDGSLADAVAYFRKDQ